MPCAGNYIDDCAANKLTSNQNLHKFTSTHIYATNIMFIDISLHDTAEPFTVVNNIERQPCVRACVRARVRLRQHFTLSFVVQITVFCCVCVYMCVRVCSRARTLVCKSDCCCERTHESFQNTSSS